MSSLVSPRVAALLNKLRQADQAGQFFSGEDIAGFMRELRAINDGVKALEDRIAGDQRRSVPPSRPPIPPRPQPIGTLVFLPAAAQ